MIFAADLDGTLIFSQRHFVNIPKETQIVLVETLEGEPISHMTLQAVHLLEEISQKIRFIPVTTRTLEQYNRIRIFQNQILPDFAVTSNGARILYHGNVDKEWEKRIEDQIKYSPCDASHIFDKFIDATGRIWIKRYKFSDNYFWTFIIDEDNIPYEQVEQFIPLAHENQWSVSLQGRKLYLIPEFINKWAAVEYIREKLGEQNVISAGDSLPDYPMLKNSDMAFIPSHGELKARIDRQLISPPPNTQFTETSGMMAGEEILRKVKVLY